jgi:glyoxylase-like metal-dependent hydrolase (beta-lactamase superfamily II)
MMATPQWRIGAVEISRVVEFEKPMIPPTVLYPTLAQDLLDRHRTWLEPRYLDPASGNMWLSAHSYLVRTRQHTILVDTCVGNDKERPHKAYLHHLTTPYLDNLTAAGVAPDAIDIVLCTHLHADHVGWNTRLLNGRWVPTFPKARYLFTRAEWEHWRDDEKRALYTTDGYYQDSVLPVIESGQAEFVTMDHVIDDEVRFEPSPGHTPGHVNVRVRSGDAEAVLTGDMMHTALQIAEPDLSSCFCVDPALSAQTRRAFIESHADRPTLIMPAHFPSPSGGYVRRVGTGFRFRFDE